MEPIWRTQYDEGVPPTITVPDRPLQGLLEGTARAYPDNVATIFFGARMTYREVDDEANRLAHALQNLGVEPGDRVALVLPNCPQFVVSYYAVLKAGGVVVPTNPTYKPREFAHQFADAGVRLVITLNLFVPAIQEIQAETAIQDLIVTTIPDALPTALSYLYPLKERREGTAVHVAPGPGIHNYNALIRSSSSAYTPVPVAPSDLALLQYTGGTTGTAKAAMLTHRNLLANTMQVCAWLPDADRSGREVSMAVTPFFHVYGMTSVMNFAISVAGPMILLPRFVTKDVLHAIQRYKPTTFSGVPTMYIAINNFPDVTKYRLSSIRACISGAAPLPVEVAQAFEQLTGAHLREGYGLTEASLVTHCNPIFRPAKIGSIGLPFPGVDARVVDAEGQEVPPGEIGEILIRGPQVMAGYWQRPDETALVLRDGWLYTGDMGRVDAEGYFYIMDRKKDIIIAGGYNIYPRDVEEVLYEHPKVQEAVVAGVPDAYRGETVKAYIVLKEGMEATADEMIAFCRAHLAGFKAPRLVEFRDSLPKSMVGKHIRRILVEEERAKLTAPLGAPPLAGKEQPMTPAFCTNCGWQHDGTARFCQQCGVALTPDAQAAAATTPLGNMPPTTPLPPTAAGYGASGPGDGHWVSEERDLWQGKTIDLATGGSWSPSHYRLTTRSLFFAHGRLGSVERSVPLWAVREVTVERSLVDKARHVGDVLVKVAHADWTEGIQEVRMDDIENPEAIRDMILQQAREESYNYERRNQTMFYQGRPPTLPR